VTGVTGRRLVHIAADFTAVVLIRLTFGVTAARHTREDLELRIDVTTRAGDALVCTARDGERVVFHLRRRPSRRRVAGLAGRWVAA